MSPNALRYGRIGPRRLLSENPWFIEPNVNEGREAWGNVLRNLLPKLRTQARQLMDLSMATVTGLPMFWRLVGLDNVQHSKKQFPCFLRAYQRPYVEVLLLYFVELAPVARGIGTLKPPQLISLVFCVCFILHLLWLPLVLTPTNCTN